RAAPTAAATSASVAAGTVPTTDPSTALCTSTRSADAAGDHTPPMYRLERSSRALVMDSPGASFVRCLGVQPAHPREPAVVVGGLPTEVVDDLGVGQDQELLAGHAGDHVLGDLLGLDRARDGEPLPLRTAEHVGAHTLADDAGDLDT